MHAGVNTCMTVARVTGLNQVLDKQSGDWVQMYHFRNTGPRIMPPQQSSRGTDGTGDPNGDMLNPDGSIRSGKKRKSHDNVATSYVALPLNAPTGLVAASRCEALYSAVNGLSHVLFNITTIIISLLSITCCRACHCTYKQRKLHVCMCMRVCVCVRMCSCV